MVHGRGNDLGMVHTFEYWERCGRWSAANPQRIFTIATKLGGSQRPDGDGCFDNDKVECFKVCKESSCKVRMHFPRPAVVYICLLIPLHRTHFLSYTARLRGIFPTTRFGAHSNAPCKGLCPLLCPKFVLRTAILGVRLSQFFLFKDLQVWAQR